MHPYTNDTLIIIDIQAPDQLEILTCVRETFDFMPGWVVGSSVHCSPTDARFFIFNLTLHTFEWWRKNDTYSDTMDEDEVAIKDIADISNLLEFVWLNGDHLRTTYIQPDYEKENLASEFEKFFGEPNFLHKDNDISKADLDELAQKIHYCKTIPSIHDVLKGTLGFHGPLVDELRKMASKAIDKIDAVECILGNTGLPYEATTKIKLSNLQSAHKSLGMKAEVDEYMSYLLQKKAAYTNEAYDHAYKECHKASKVWSQGWGYIPYPSDKINTLKPYSWFDVHGKGPMDY